MAEEHHDDAGLAWPEAVAPYAVHLVALGAGRSPETWPRPTPCTRPGRARRRGPLRRPGRRRRGSSSPTPTCSGSRSAWSSGSKGVARGVAEWRHRRSGEERELPLDGAAAVLSGARLAPGVSGRAAALFGKCRDRCAIAILVCCSVGGMTSRSVGRPTLCSCREALREFAPVTGAGRRRRWCRRFARPLSPVLADLGLELVRRRGAPGDGARHRRPRRRG